MTAHAALAASTRPPDGVRGESGGSEGSVFAQVLRASDRGLTAERIAEQLGLPGDVVALVLEHAERLGLVMRPAGGSSCRTGCPTGPDKPPSCFGCPLSR